MIKTVTFTGADNATDINRMIGISRQYPFLEWGILVSPARYNKPRWPNDQWITESWFHSSRNLNLSLHLCEDYVNEILIGNDNVLTNRYKGDIDFFNRIQINTHGVPTYYHEEALIMLLNRWPEKEFIFQYDNVNTAFDVAARKATNVSALFDLSHGTGNLPKEWPSVLAREFKCGYAGGLSPENLLQQIELIEEKAGDTPIWIDMETGVRTIIDGRSTFDFDKVERCLEIAKPFIK